ncbi:hypothetical protein PIIN_02986 [Serendipita indica DSM 11827]|uniref:Transmembrane protein n=1 Tax=Serendipita indica (strain DSM 11827) TaxID=1109443 RepID=G4U2E3_SERID|nr:hypothetical protein PIIN_02986 [Serendipita indica DSM 11827]
MPHSSPTVMLLWSVLSAMEFIFLIHHLYRYDRFACIRWDSGRQPGAFKRIMTYSYLLCIPLLMTYSLIMAYIKYDEGYMDLRALGRGVIPKPYALWPQHYKDLVLPATVCFSVGWSLEIVSHLEELNFWLFLLHQVRVILFSIQKISLGLGLSRVPRLSLVILFFGAFWLITDISAVSPRNATYLLVAVVVTLRNTLRHALLPTSSDDIPKLLRRLPVWMLQGPSQRDWFSSLEFKTWAAGATLAVVGMPTLTVLTRADPYKSEAWTCFAGGVGSTLITLWFLVVLFKFPRFLKRVRNEGADAEVVVRLTTFDELNRIRVGFRFFFAGSFLILATDGILPGDKPINTSPFWTDLLSMTGAIGCVVSSMLTLLIFFPRSIAKEAGYKAKTVSLNSRGTSNNPPASPTVTFYNDNNTMGMVNYPRQSSIGLAVTTDPAPMYQPSPTMYAQPGETRSTTPNSAMLLNANVNSTKTPAGGRMPYGAYAYGGNHGGVGSGPAEWELDSPSRVHGHDIEAYHAGADPREYLKMQSEQSLAHVDLGSVESGIANVGGDNKQRVKTGSARAPVRPPRPAEPILHPLILNYTSPIDLLDQATSRPPRPPRHPRRL